MKKLTLQLIYTFLVRWFLKLFVGVKFDDSSFLVEEKQFIILANHNSHLDTMSLMASLPRSLVHKVKPVAALDHFGKTKFQERMSNFFINTLLIPRKRDKENPANDPIHKMIQALDNGYSLILFPEGTRGEPEQEQPLKPGIGLVLSQRPDVKFVPAYMKGMGKSMPKGDNLILPYNASLTYGKATHVQSTKVGEILSQLEEIYLDLKNKTDGHDAP
ncbi:MAG: lysophospholipid acyltransferase family protein [Saprospiraceae bacterium]|nr:lysophospholipid acyltransferase family protein [Saprospiraceae bacterium]